MKDWNVTITVYQDGYKRARRALREFGAATVSPYYNVLGISVADPLGRSQISSSSPRMNSDARPRK